jgi:hypothetical protein
VLGDGGHATPFCVSMTSKAMLNVLHKANSCVFPVVLHMDCTFKLNDNEFPLVVIGITDSAQQLHVLSVDPQGNAYSVKNLEKNALYAVNCQDSSCTCKAFVKYGYCKHLLFVLKSTNRSSATIDLSSVRTFVYRGNTRRAREHANNGTARANRPQRGRVPQATSALNRM